MRLLTINWRSNANERLRIIAHFYLWYTVIFDLLFLLQLPSSARAKPFNKLGLKELKWDSEGYVSQDSRKVISATIEHALNMWSLASEGVLEFTDLSGTNETANIDVFFARWDHGDHEPFDGRGGIVAHSGYPMEGKVHFDASELWTINGNKGVDLRYVTLHELGHSLGLRHSRHKTAIMHPIYLGSHKTLSLTQDDMRGIQYLYGKPAHPNMDKANIRATIN